jgi:DNA-binding CsgD family transcriptional regulator
MESDQFSAGQDVYDKLLTKGFRSLTKEHLFCYYPWHMSIWDRFTYLIGLRQTPGPRTYHLDVSDSLQVTLSTIAKDEGRPEHDLIPELLTAGLNQYTSNERLWKKWETLSLREKDVTAFVCLGYTNREIGARLNISPETVKDRLESTLHKFQFTKRTELRVLLASWDFSEWERQ